MIMVAAIMGALLFLSVSIGAGVALIFSKLFGMTNLSLSLISGGFLVGIIFIDILPHSISEYDDFGLVLGFIFGFILFEILHYVLHRVDSKHDNSFKLIFIAMLLHTIPISFSIGTVLNDSVFSSVITTATILHHIPEGFALTLAMIAQGGKMLNLILYLFFLSLIFSSFLMLGQVSVFSMKVNTILMGTSIGLIANTSIREFIINKVSEHPNRHSLTYTLIGLGMSMLFHLFV